MKSGKVTIITISLLLIGVSGACWSRRADEPVVRRYELKGRVESLDVHNKRLTVAHEDIKGYMEAMTMSFAVKDEKALQGLKSGDQVRATLIYDSGTNLSWLEDVKLIENAKQGK